MFGPRTALMNWRYVGTFQAQCLDCDLANRGFEPAWISDMHLKAKGWLNDHDRDLRCDLKGFRFSFLTTD